VVLSDVEGIPQVEIARILNISEGTVRSRLHYAHQQLRKMLGNYLKA
jgi:RNA polymerase sigma-70 factor (ECF subfamily)